MLTGWTRWVASRLDSWLACWLTRGLAECLIDLLVEWLSLWLAAQTPVWVARWPTVWRTGSAVVCLADLRTGSAAGAVLVCLLFCQLAEPKSPAKQFNLKVHHAVLGKKRKILGDWFLMPEKKQNKKQISKLCVFYWLNKLNKQTDLKGQQTFILFYFVYIWLTLPPL